MRLLMVHRLKSLGARIVIFFVTLLVLVQGLAAFS
jgi:hypothetical protein